jgi:hypothetical protein
MTSGISICIPSFNRMDELIGTLDEILLGVSDYQFVQEVILLDNGYVARERNHIKSKFSSFEKFRIISVGERKSFGDVFLACLKAAQMDYVLVSYDDDRLFVNGLVDLYAQVSTDNFGALYVPAWNGIQGGVIRGSMGRAQKVESGDLLRYLAHGPGLLYNKAVLNNELAQLEEILQQGCVFTQMYPQVLLGALILNTARPIVSVPLIIGQDGKAMPTEIKTVEGDDYYSLRARLHQYLCLLRLDEIRLLDSATIVRLRIEFLARILLLESWRIVFGAIMLGLRRATVSQYRLLKHEVKRLFF